jgi:isopentenyl diphosphate isomerase/L-lactate dehydrogenase-like FMN-dependent dehydrogenase
VGRIDDRCLAAYGADGVQGVLEMLQGDLARNMGALGAPNLAGVTRAMIRVHRR